MKQHEDKNLLYIAWSPAQYAHSKQLGHCLQDFGFKLYVISGISCANVIYEPLNVWPINKLEKMLPIGYGFKGRIKKILCYPLLRKSLYKIFYPFWVLPFIARIFFYHKLVKDFNREVRKRVKLLQCAAIICPHFPRFPWEIILYPKVDIPIVGCLAYSYITKNKLLEHLEKNFNGSDSAGRNGRFWADLLVSHWGREDSKGKIFYPAMPVFLLTALVCGVPRFLTLSSARRLLSGGFFPSEREKKYVKEFGPIPESWPVTGDVSSDILAVGKLQRSSKLSSFFKQFGFKYPRTAAFDLNRFLEERYYDLWLRLALVASSAGWNVIFCPHPGLDEARKARFRNEDFVVAELHTAEVLPMADLYLTFQSSSSLMAAQLGIPVISLVVDDHLGLADWPGSICYDKKDMDEFEIYTKDLLQDNSLYAALHAKAQTSCSEYGILDGKGAERIAAYLRLLLAKERPKYK